MKQKSDLKIDSNGLVYLTIRNGYKNSRRIGSVKGDVFHTTKSRDKHVLKLNNSIGITAGLFDLPKIRYFCIKLDNEPLWISKDFAFKVKTEMFWKKPQLERQYFIRLDEFSSTRGQAERINNFELTESLTLF